VTVLILHNVESVYFFYSNPVLTYSDITCQVFIVVCGTAGIHKIFGS